MRMNRGELQLLLYMGSESGLEKAALGFKVSKDDLARLVERNASKEDVAWANGVHEIYQMLWPEIEALELRYSGVAPDQVDPLPRTLTLASGEKVDMKGGYTPIEYDRRRGKIEAHIAAKSELFEDQYRRAAVTPHSYTKARTSFASFLDLNPKNFARHIRQEIHDIAFREVVKDGWKLVNDPTFREAMIDRWGEERYNLFPQGIKDLANVQRVDETFCQGARGRPQLCGKCC